MTQTLLYGINSGSAHIELKPAAFLINAISKHSRKKTKQTNIKPKHVKVILVTELFFSTDACHDAYERS